MTECDETVTVIKNLSTKKTNTIASNDGIVKLEGFDLDNILIDEKSHDIFWFIIFHIKL